MHDALLVRGLERGRRICRAIGSASAGAIGCEIISASVRPGTRYHHQRVYLAGILEAVDRGDVSDD
jgi:hypothetical protein